MATEAFQQANELEQLRAENAELRKRCATAKANALWEACRNSIAIPYCSSASDLRWELLRMADKYLAELKEPKP